MSRRIARRQHIPRLRRDGGWNGWPCDLKEDGISGITWPTDLMIRQCGLWKRRGFHHGTHDRVDPIDDPCPMPSAAAYVQVSVAATDSAADEDGGTGTFTITREGNTTPPLVVYFGLTGTADIGVDYTASVSSPVTIPAGASSVTVTVTPIQDAITDEDETVILSLVPTTYGPIYDIDWEAFSATVTITEDGDEEN